MLSSWANVINWEEMLSPGIKCYHLGCNVIIIWSYSNVFIWDKMISSGANVIMLQSVANVIIWCYHVMLSSGMITPPFFYFSWKLHSLREKEDVRIRGKSYGSIRAITHARHLWLHRCTRTLFLVEAASDATGIARISQLSGSCHSRRFGPSAKLSRTPCWASSLGPSSSVVRMQWDALLASR